MSGDAPRCPRCDCEDCPAAAVTWREVAALADGWAPAGDAEDDPRVLDDSERHGCHGEPVDWRARALEAESERGALLARCLAAVEAMPDFAGPCSLCHGTRSDEYGAECSECDGRGHRGLEGLLRSDVLAALLRAGGVDGRRRHP